MSECGTLKRKRKCVRCCLEPNWDDDHWECKKRSFQELGLATQSAQQKQNAKKKRTKKQHLTAAQKASLVGAVYLDSGKCVLCESCFCEFTNVSENIRSDISKTIKQIGDRTQLLFDHGPFLSHHFQRPSSHKVSVEIENEVKLYCYSGVFHWDPKQSKVCFNSDVNSWVHLFNSFQKFYFS